MKDIYELLNDAEMNMDNYEIQNLSDYEKKIAKKKILKEIRNMKKNKKFKSSVVAACLCGIVAVGGLNVAAATGLLPLPGTFRSAFGVESTEKETIAKQMGGGIHVVSEDQGYKITAEGALNDAERLWVSFRAERSDKSNLHKDGKRCTYASLDYASLDLPQEGQLSQGYAWTPEIPEASETSVICFSMQEIGWEDADGWPIPRDKMPPQESYKLYFDKLTLGFGDEQVEVDGNWSFDIPLTENNCSVDLADGRKITYGKNSGRLDKLEISPLGYTIEITCDAGEEISGENELIRGLTNEQIICFKNGEKLKIEAGGGPSCNDDGTWTYRLSTHFDRMIPLEDMEKFIFGQGEEFEIHK